MARTCLDPWQWASSDLVWKNSTLSTIISSHLPVSSSFSSGSSYAKPNSTASVGGLKVIPKFSSKFPPHHEKFRKFPVSSSSSFVSSHAKPNSTSSKGSLKVISKVPSKLPHHVKPIKLQSILKSSDPNTVKTSPHPSPQRLPKNVSNVQSKSNHEHQIATSRIFAGMNIANLSENHNKCLKFDRKPKPKRRKLIGLPDGDKRKNMIPKVILRDIGHIISKVCPTLSTLQHPEWPNQSTSKGTDTETYQKEIEDKRPLILLTSPAPDLTMRQSVATPPYSPEVILDPPLLLPEGTTLMLCKPPVVTLDDTPLPIGTAEVVIGEDPRTLRGPSPSSIMKGISSAFAETDKLSRTSSIRKSPTISEKSSTLVSRKTATSDVSRSVLPVFLPRLFSPNSSEEVWPSFSKLSPTLVIESVSSISSKSSTSTNVSHFPSSQKSVFTPSEDMPKVQSKPRAAAVKSESSVKKQLSSWTEDRSVGHSGKLTRSGLTSCKAPSRRTSFNAVENLPSPTALKKPSPLQVIQDGFLGFPLEDGRKLKKTRFHVNTNILASSLDILDLHQTAESPSGSPSSCSLCNTVFSSVKHCKYHQSVVSSDLDPARHHNVQEDNVWLCPWCPLMSSSNEYLNKHKQVCREKGRCQPQDPKASSSVRKNAINSSRKKSTSNFTPLSPMKGNSFKIVRGVVIPF